MDNKETKKETCNFERLALLVDSMIAVMLIAGGAVAILSLHQVNMGPLNAVSQVGPRCAEAMLGVGLTLIVLDFAIFCLKIRAKRLVDQVNSQIKTAAPVIIEKKVQDETVLKELENLKLLLIEKDKVIRELQTAAPTIITKKVSEIDESLASELQSLKIELDLLKTKYESLVLEKSKMEGEKNKIIEDLKKRILELEEKLRKKEIGHQCSHLKEKEDQVFNLETDLTKAQKQINELKRQNRGLKEQLEKLSPKDAALGKKIKPPIKEKEKT